jgi:hypothetical protein
MPPLFASLALVVAAVACVSAPDSAATDDPARAAPGPKTPLAPDHALDQAPPLDIHAEDEMHAWLETRLAAARDGVQERVRLPLVRRALAFGCDCPPHAIAPTTDNGPFYWVAITDLTSVGIPQHEWLGWVDGRFTGQTRVYRSTDAGGRDMVLPVFEVLRQRARTPDEEPQVRFVRQ